MKKFVWNVWDYLKVSPMGRWLWFVLRRRFCVISRRSLALKAINDFGCEYLTPDEKKLLLADMIECAKKYRFSYDEYFRFRLQHKSDFERYAFVSDIDIISYVDRLNKPKNHHLFADKTMTARTFAKFFQREYCECESVADVESLTLFLTKHKKVIVKPISSCSGSGIKLIEVADEHLVPNVARELVERYCTSKYSGAIVEELIDQDERMAILHPQSVNTVRITTIRLDDRTVVLGVILIRGACRSIFTNQPSNVPTIIFDSCSNS